MLLLNRRRAHVRGSLHSCCWPLWSHVSPLRPSDAPSACAASSVWTRPAVAALLASSLLSGLAQALDYTAQVAAFPFAVRLTSDCPLVIV